MHRDEIRTDVPLVRRLLAAQFPHWADLTLERLPSPGTENAIYRLGDELAVRLPLRPGSAQQVQKLQRWLPRLRPLLPLAIPVLLAKGAPSQEFPEHWSVYAWLEGETATAESTGDLAATARRLADFIAALQRVDAAGGPPPGAHNFFRGVPLATRDTVTRAALAALRGTIDVDAATSAWESARSAPAWDRPPVWIHGDLKADNLLVVNGELSAIIDFGGLGVGDPACDLIVAWDLLQAESREVLRAALCVDAATWRRGRGWALSTALIALPYYLDTHPAMVRHARHVIENVLADRE